MAVRRRPAWEAPGRHFLRSKRLAADLVAHAGVGRGDLVVEIGGGKGVLTDAIARAGGRLVVVERDPSLAAGLRRRFADHERVRVVQADAAAHAWPLERFSVVANLPFAHSGAILRNLLRDPQTPLERAVVIVQWEFAAKHGAVWPATLRSSYWRAWYDVAPARRIDRTAFAPPPSVDAGVLAVARRGEPLVPIAAHAAYWSFLSATFSSRQPVRRCLQPALSPLQVKRLAPALGFSLAAHASDLDAHQWAGLFEAARGIAHAGGRCS